MKKLLLGALLATLTLSASPVMAQPDRSWSDQQRDADNQANQRHASRDNDRDHADQRVPHRDRGRHRGWQKRAAWQDYTRYDYNRFDPRYGNYRADRYYRDGRYYQDRRLTSRDRIYRGSNGQYYCRRSDGTTGLIIGAIGGGLLGRAIAPNSSKTLGTILGGVGGALIGREIGRNGVWCN
jgi:hypothetical protein